MKVCTRCKEPKSFDLFAKRSSARDGLSSWCKSCFAVHAKKRYQEGDRTRKVRNNKAFCQRNKENLWEILCSSKCLHCGDSDPEILEFDHRDPETKSHNVVEMLCRYSWSSIQSEIEKCDILCVKCHRKKTIKQFGYWRGTMAHTGV